MSQTKQESRSRRCFEHYPKVQAKLSTSTGDAKWKKLGLFTQNKVDSMNVPHAKKTPIMRNDRIEIHYS